MQLRDMRYAKIEGTEVLVEVHSSADAKAAIKELKHKKKEIALLKRRMAKQQSIAKRAIERAEAAAERDAKKRGLFQVLKRVSRVFKEKPPAPDLDAITRDIDNADEILHNIESCIIQLEGRLLA